MSLLDRMMKMHLPRVGVLVTCCLLCIGCATDSAQRTDGPPPEGYESWNDYYDQQDQLAAEREYELQRLQHERTRNQRPGQMR